MSRPAPAPRRTAGRARLLAAAAPLLALLATTALVLVGPAAPASAATSTSYGAVPIGTARYPVPTTAVRFVAPSGSDAAAGTLAAPYRTLGKALSASPTGTTIVLRGGAYRESASVYAKKLVIQNYPGEAVWLTGSDPVSGWVADGDDWRKDGWTPQFRRGTIAEHTDPAFPLAAYPDQLFVGGASQKQVASRSAVVPGTFFADYANQRLYMGSNPSGQQVEASARKRGLYLNQAHGTVVRGIGFSRYANHPDDLGALLAEGSGILVENCVLVQNASVGVTLLGPDSVVRSSSVTDNGQIGVHAHRAHRFVVEKSLLQHNNTERFHMTGAQGNLKATEIAGATVRDNLVRYAQGRGLWFDLYSTGINIVRNAVVSNLDRGVELELTDGGIVAGNLFADNGSDALSVLASKNVQVYNNSFWYNGRAVFVINDSRAAVQNVAIRNNVVGGSRPGTQQILAVEDVTRTRTAWSMGVTTDRNAYAQVNGTAAWWFGWADYPNRFQVHSSLTSYRSATGQEAGGGAVTASGADPFFTSPTTGDYTLRTGSLPTALAPAALPSSVAAALGTATGSTPALGAQVQSSGYTQPVWAG